MAVYSFLLAMTLVLGAPYWLVRMMTSGKYRAGLAGRLGRIPEAVRTAGRNSANNRPGLVWVHAVSVGEVLAATAMVRDLQAAGCTVAVSTTTQAGQELAKRRFPECAVFYMPLDFAVLVRRYMDALKPRLVVTMESELWPNLIQECRKAAIPIAVVNARVSDRSFPRYMRLRGLWRPILGGVSVFLAQSEETADRLRRIGVAAEKVQVSGNLKYDVKAAEPTVLTRRVGDLLGGTRLIVAGSTLAGEEEVLLALWLEIQKAVPYAVLLIAPRHTDRFDEVLGLIRKSGSPFFRCSELMFDADPLRVGTILLLDTIGDLASTYSLAAVAFVGGSVVAKGGHNPLEPAQFGVPVVMGASYENFREIVGLMKESEAIRIVQQQELGGALIELMTERKTAEAMGARGRKVFEAQAGATSRTVKVLIELIGAGRG